MYKLTITGTEADKGSLSLMQRFIITFYLIFLSALPISVEIGHGQSQYLFIILNYPKGKALLYTFEIITIMSYAETRWFEWTVSSLILAVIIINFAIHRKYEDQEEERIKNAIMEVQGKAEFMRKKMKKAEEIKKAKEREREEEVDDDGEEDDGEK